MTLAHAIVTAPEAKKLALSAAHLRVIFNLEMEYIVITAALLRLSPPSLRSLESNQRFCRKTKAKLAEKYVAGRKFAMAAP